MKNLKRVLSLVLALMMALSLMAFSSSASAADSTIPVASELAGYSDVDDAYKEAADVVVALGIIQGKDSGLDPDGNLTRAEAVIMIVRVLVGDAISGLVPADVFSDVPATFPGSESIAYAVNTGIVSGDAGSNKFFPSDELNVASFGKILLGALGYDTDKQGYTGTMWAVNVFRDMRTAGISLDGVTNPFATLTRQQAMQMVFQTLKADMVEYVNGSNTATKVVNNATDYTNNNAKPTSSDDTIQQFCEFYYPKLVLSTAASDAKDAFGRPIATWKLNNVKICETESSSTATVTYTASVNATRVAGDLAGYSVTMGDESSETVGNTNSVAKTLPYIRNGSDSATLATSATVASKIASLTGNGTLVEIYTEDNTITKIVVIDTALMSIGRITDSQVTLSTKVNPIGTIAAVSSSNKYFTTLSGMTAGDLVLVTAAKDSSSNNYVVQSVAVPDVVTGNVTAKTTGTNASVTVGGQRYSIAANEGSVSTLSVDATAEVNLYLDAYGYAIYSEGVTATASDVKAVYVTVIYDASTTWGSKRMFQGVLPNGDVITGALDSTSAEMSTGDKNKVYIYSIDANGEYRLKNNSDTDNNDVTAVAITGTSGAAKFGADGTISSSDTKLNSTIASANQLFFASNVKFIYVSGKEDSINVIVRDGVQAASIESDTDYYVVDTIGGTKVVTAVFLASDPISDNSDIIYVASGKTSTTTKLGDDGRTRLYGHEVYLNGVKQTIYTTSGDALTPGFKSYTVSEQTGAYNLTDMSDVANLKGTQDVLVNGVARIDSATYYVTGFESYNAADAIVVDTRSGGTIDSIAALYEANASSRFTLAIAADNNTKTVLTIYVKDSIAQISGTSTTEIKSDEKANLVDDATIATVAGTVTFSDAETLTTTTIKKGASINTGENGTLNIDNGGTIEAGANITIGSLDGITVGTGVTVNEAVKLDTTAVTSGDLKDVAVGVPVFVSNPGGTPGSNSNIVVGESKDVAENTIFFSYAGRVASKVVTLTITGTNGDRYVETLTPTNANVGNFYVDLKIPYTGGANATFTKGASNNTSGFVPGVYYTVTIVQATDGGDTALLTTGFTCPTFYTAP